MELDTGFLKSVPRYIFSGRFGSGKTEVAVNFALELREKHTGPATPPCRPTLIDLDIVTPYFRSRELRDALQERGVEVVSPATVAQHLDTPAISPQIRGELQQDDHPVVLDVGGDEQGARALGQYSPLLRERGYVMYFVINPYRPFTHDTVGIRESIEQIERSSRLLVTGLVSNPHMLSETTTELFWEGQRIVELASQQSGLPIVLTAVERTFLRALRGSRSIQTPILPLERFLAMPWA